MKTPFFIDQLQSVNNAAWFVYSVNPSHQPKRNMSPSEIKTMFGALYNHNVKYLLVGGFAMAFHGYVRATKDIDLWIKNEPGNMQRLKEALIETGISEVKWMRDTTQLVGGISVFTLLGSDLTVDLLHNMKAFKENDFDVCYSRAKKEMYYGFEVAVIDAEDLLKEKLNTHRAKDIPDILFLAKKTNYRGPLIDPQKLQGFDLE